jgi:hypothetical protein
VTLSEPGEFQIQIMVIDQAPGEHTDDKTPDQSGNLVPEKDCNNLNDYPDKDLQECTGLVNPYLSCAIYSHRSTA